MCRCSTEPCTARTFLTQRIKIQRERCKPRRFGRTLDISSVAAARREKVDSRCRVVWVARPRRPTTATLTLTPTTLTPTPSPQTKLQAADWRTSYRATDCRPQARRPHPRCIVDTCWVSATVVVRAIQSVRNLSVVRVFENKANKKLSSRRERTNPGFDRLARGRFAFNKRNDVSLVFFAPLFVVLDQCSYNDRNKRDTDAHNSPT